MSRLELRAIPGVTVTGPRLVTLGCGCCVDDTGAVWQPCIEISIEHGRAVQEARLGWARGDPAEAMARIAAHVASERRAMDAEQDPPP